MTNRQQSAFFLAIVFLFTSGTGLLIYRQYDQYYQQKASLDLEAASTAVLVKKSPVAVAPQQTEVWKTYRNDRYGFEFQYPIEFVYKETLSHFTDFDNLDIDFTSSLANKGFRFVVNEPGLGVEGYDLISQEDKLINGVKMREQVFGDSQTKSASLVIFEFTKNNNSFMFFVNLDKISKSNFESIVSTFKFTSAPGGSGQAK